MKFDKAIERIRHPKKAKKRSVIFRALELGAGVATTAWLALRVRKHIYGPGGTKLSRYPSRPKSDS
ncbi:MAG: hypothetical protein M3O61_14735 [Gemmatimonadota bacterium]|nr:hypothetical protein [Gemmatimonadota bacterium]